MDISNLHCHENIIDLTQDSDEESETEPTQPARPRSDLNEVQESLTQEQVLSSSDDSYASTITFSEIESDSDASACPTELNESLTQEQVLSSSDEYDDEEENSIGYTNFYPNYFNLESMVFRFGKFHGSSVSQLMNKKQYRYLQWVACQDDFNQPKIVQHIRDHVLQHTKLQFGNFSHLTLFEIKTKHPRYWFWLRKWKKNLKFLRHV